jgi:HD-GYP domain-containing protein (c-di-GMP phosphodiesterase class II)
VLAVADAWEAMTADRHYRAALPVAVALLELQAHRGTQFDLEVVDALTALVREGELSDGSDPSATAAPVTGARAAAR